jgi:sigma-B regulation protein RsbU (phosphoserine phosphatase)
LPAAELGGDFFDILEVSETRIGIFICDVMGHGVSAGLVAGIVRGLIEEARPNADDPAAFLTDLNRGMRAVLCHTDVPIFATAFYAVFDLEAEKLFFASAGHPAPLFFDRHSDEIELVVSAPNTAGPALGLFEGVIYEQGHRDLRPNDVVVLYTDGLSDVTNSNGTTFGNHRLLHAVRQHRRDSIPELSDFLLADAKAFSDQENFEDDVCILGIQMLPATAKKKADQRTDRQTKLATTKLNKRSRVKNARAKG